MTRRELRQKRKKQRRKRNEFVYNHPLFIYIISVNFILEIKIFEIRTYLSCTVD
jgi:hypothetical protein